MSRSKPLTKSQNVANYILSLSNPEIGDIVSNLKLQKLLYYVQGFHLALSNGTPIFNENIEAWEYGPVVPTVYREHKHRGANFIEKPSLDKFRLSKKEMELINEVYETYGQYSAWRLMEMTHEEMPWKETEKGDVISNDLLTKYFKTQLMDG